MMTDANGQPLTLDADVLEGTSDGSQIAYQTEDGQTVTTLETNAEAADIVSKALAESAEPNVEYTTMTAEEAAAAGVVVQPEDEQVVTTSLQFDPANPSVLYTADGTPINQADLTPEEQALVQAALQQHLAEQEAEQQLALMQESGQVQEGGEQAAMEVDGNIVTSTSLTGDKQIITHSTHEQIISSGASIVATAAEGIIGATTDATVTSTLETGAFNILSDAIDLASPDTSASQIVQSLADNVRKQQLQDKLLTNPKNGDDPLKVTSTNASAAAALTSGAQRIAYSEKIILKQGQPQVVKIPTPRKPEIPAALANLMPKVEVGKDGSQVIRIHQSQITPNQLKALQDNPNVRLVFRPASSARPKPVTPVVNTVVKKRGRPRKGIATEAQPTAKISLDNFIKMDTEEEEPPTKTTRCGRLSKRPGYTKDYLTPKGMKEMDDDPILDRGDDIFRPNSPQSEGKKGRGRPLGSKNYKRPGSYASKMEALRAHVDSDSALSIQSNKPALTPIEQALSTRRKNKLREMLGACSEDEIMEVALPHLARVFSLWEFLVTKVEKNKMARVFFADVYKEYECLHKYVSKLAEKYKQAIEANKTAPETSETTATAVPKEAEKADGEKVNGETEKEGEIPDDSKVVHVMYAKLAESLGLEGTTLQEAEISLIDPEEAIGPRIMGLAGGARRSGQYKYSEDQSSRKVKPQTILGTGVVKNDSIMKSTTAAAKPIQTEATSTNSTLTSLAQNAGMPALKQLGQITKVTIPETRTVTSSAPVINGTEADVTAQAEASNAETPMETDAAAVPTAVDALVTAAQEKVPEATTEGTGTQLIQIGEGDEQQYIEVPEGYTLIQTPEGLVMSQPGTTISQGDDGNIYITHADGTTTPLNVANQEGVSMETVESLLSLDGQQQAQS